MTWTGLLERIVALFERLLMVWMGARLGEAEQLKQEKQIREKVAAVDRPSSDDLRQRLRDGSF